MGEVMVRSWVESRRRRAQQGTKMPTHRSEDFDHEKSLSFSADGKQNALQKKPSMRKGAVTRRTGVLVAVVRGIGTPLQSAVSEVATLLRGQGYALTSSQEAKAFGDLVQQIVQIGKTIHPLLGFDVMAPEQNNEHTRWALLEAISENVGAIYRARGQLSPVWEMSTLLPSLVKMARDSAASNDLIPAQGDEHEQLPLILGLLKALPPVCHAIGRHSFQQDTPTLILQTARTLQYKSITATRGLLKEGAPLDDWQALYCSFLIAAGQLYAEAHFAIAEGSRANVSAAQAQESIWTAFDRKMTMIATFSSYMAPPAAEKIEQRNVKHLADATG